MAVVNPHLNPQKSCCLKWPSETHAAWETYDLDATLDSNFKEVNPGKESGDYGITSLPVPRESLSRESRPHRK